jgi:hypothetical protein
VEAVDALAERPDAGPELRVRHSVSLRTCAILGSVYSFDHPWDKEKLQNYKLKNRSLIMISCLFSASKSRRIVF